MNNVSLPQLTGTVKQIRKTEEMVKGWEQHQPDQIADFEIYQYEQLKQAFLRQLLAGLLQSNYSVRELEPFLKKAIGWLINYNSPHLPLPDELIESLKEVEQMFAGREIPMPDAVKNVMLKFSRKKALHEEHVA